MNHPDKPLIFAYCQACAAGLMAQDPKNEGRQHPPDMCEHLRAALAPELTAEIERLKRRFTAPVVCLCGSTRFKQTWIAENARLTGEGNIVLAVGLWGHHERIAPTPEQKISLDALHKRKIDLCDWVWVLDVGGYVGESTRSEIAYALALGKPVRYLSLNFPDHREPEDPLLLRAESAERERDEALRVRDLARAASNRDLEAKRDVEQANRVANDLMIQALARARELERMIEFVANLQSAYWVKPANDHGWRLIETDCGAMRLRGEGDSPEAAIRAALAPPASEQKKEVQP